MGHCLLEKWKCASRLLKFQWPTPPRHADISPGFSGQPTMFASVRLPHSSDIAKTSQMDFIAIS